MSVQTILAYQAVGCYGDNPGNPNTILTSSLQASNVEDCMTACDATISISVCAFKASSPPVCMGGLYNSPTWATYGKRSDGVCSSSNSDAFTIYSKGWGNIRKTYSTAGPTNKASPAALPALPNLKVELLGCFADNSSTLITIVSDTTPEDCLAECNFHGYPICAIEYGSRNCYASGSKTMPSTDWLSSNQVPNGDCDAPCRFPNPLYPNIQCGGMRLNGPRFSIYRFGHGTTLDKIPALSLSDSNAKSVIPPDVADVASPNIPSVGVGSNSTSTSETSLGTIIGSVVGSACFIILIIFLIVRYRQRKHKTEARERKIFPAHYAEGLPEAIITTGNRTTSMQNLSVVEEGKGEMRQYSSESATPTVSSVRMEINRSIAPFNF